jgi:lyso-ornithine lipid O-acyltransferase
MTEKLSFTGRTKLVGIAMAAAIGVPLQIVAHRLGPRTSHGVPMLFHRVACRVLGVRIRTIGVQPPTNQSVLIVSNHLSWMDVPVIGSVRKLAFVSKAEVAGWPGIGLMARLQRTLFIDRTRRSETARTSAEMGARLGGGETVVLFAEGTTGDGSRILPFKSALLGAVRDALGSKPASDLANETELIVQPLAIAYVGRNGLPGGRVGRADLSWIGDAELKPHAWNIFNGGPIDVVMIWCEPIRVGRDTSRKIVTQQAEDAVRTAFRKAIHGRALG